MNERFEQLAQQAGIITNLETDYYEDDENFGKWVDYYSEKLAELIVRECATLIEENMDPYNAWITPGDIKQHFGVE